MTCKDCIHHFMCNIRILDKDKNNIPCKYFKDKNKIIELPCKVGETVYFISKEYTKCSIYNDYSSNCDNGCYEVCEKGFICDSKEVQEIREVLVDGFEINSLGFKILLHNGRNVYLPDDRVFLSKEDAENKLGGGEI